MFRFVSAAKIPRVHDEHVTLVELVVLMLQLEEGGEIGERADKYTVRKTEYPEVVANIGSKTKGAP